MIYSYNGTLSIREPMIHATGGMKLENYLTERSSSKRPAYGIIQCIRNVWTGKCIVIESRLLVTRDEREKRRGNNY